MPAKKWSQQRVRDAIRARQRRRLPLNHVWKDHPALYAAAKVQFGSWRRALIALGEPVRPPYLRWSADRVVAAIAARHCSGADLSQTWIDDPRLYDAARRWCGGWRQALVRTGIPVPFEEMTRHTPTDVLAEIQRRAQEGLPLRGNGMRQLLVYRAARWHFGNWRRAVDAAGVNVPWRQRWDADRVLAEIRKRHVQRLPLSNVVNSDRPLSCAARKYFGSWGAAVRAAGFDYESPRRWTRPALIVAIRAWYPQGIVKKGIWKTNIALAAAARQHFGSWHKALRAAGLRPLCRLWSNESVLIALQAWGRRRSRTSLSHDDRGLVTAARTRFGSLQKAMTIAGVEPRPRRWTRARILAAIQNRRVQGLSLATSGTTVDQALVSAASLHFGRWSTALREAGIPVRLRRRWTPHQVIEEIGLWCAQGRPLKRVRREFSALRAAGCRYFGSWSRTLAAARRQGAIP